MMLSPDNILRKTHAGFSVYAYVLRQYYKDQALHPYNETKPVKNPFANDTPTLIVELRNNVATHRDLVLKDFKGDVFDFANLHFKCATQEELYFMINQVLGLGLSPTAALAFLEGEDDFWKPQVSFFRAPISNTRSSETLSLWEVHKRITGPGYRDITLELRALKGKKEQSLFKATRFSYVTFSGIFTKRSDQALTAHSGLIALDLDHLSYVAEVRSLLLEEPEFDTELLFVSPSGDGLKWIVRFDPKQVTQRDFFREAAAYLHRKYRLEVDPACKDVSRACFLPFDPECYLHPRHKEFN